MVRRPGSDRIAEAVKTWRLRPLGVPGIAVSGLPAFFQ